MIVSMKEVVRSTNILIVILFFLFHISFQVSAQNDFAMKVQTGHSGSVTGVDLSSDGKYMVTAGMDEQTIIWEVKTGREIITLPSSQFVTIFPDGKQFIMESEEKYYFDIREFPSGKIVRTLNLPYQENFYRLSISPDGKYMVTGLGEVYEAESGTHVSSLESGGTIWDINFSPDGKYIVAGCRWVEAEVFDTFTGKSVKKFNNHATGTTAAAFSIDGKSIFTAFETVLKQWNFATGQLIRSIKLTAEPLRFEPSQDGKTLLIGTNSGTAQILDLTTGTVTKTFGKGPKYGGGYAEFLKDQKHILVQHIDPVNGSPVFKIWRISDQKKPLKEFGSNVNYLDEIYYNRDNPLQFAILEHTAGTDVNGERISKARALQVWDLSKGKIIKTYNLNNLSYYIIQDIRFTNNEIHAMIAIKQDAYVLYDVVKGKVIREFFNSQFDQDVNFLGQGLLAIRRYTKEYPRTLVQLDIVEVATGAIVKSHKASVFNGRPGYFSENGKYALCFGAEYKPFLYDLESGALIREFVRREKVNIGFEGRMFSETYKEYSTGRLKLYSLPDFNEQFSADFEIRNQSEIHRISDSQKFFASTRENGKVVLIWSIDMNRVIHEFRMPEGEATFLRFSPDERSLLISDKYLYNLDTEKFTVLQDYKFFGFSPDGKFLLSSGANTKNWGKIPVLHKYHSLEDGSEVFTVVSIKGYNSDYVVFTPDGYYFTTKKAADNVHYVKRGKVFLFDQFDLYFNRPDIVLSRMGYADPKLIESYKKAFDKRRKKMGIAKEDFTIEELFNVPEVRVTSNMSQGSTTSKTYNLSLEASDPSVDLEKIHVWINGVPQFGKGGMTTAANEKTLQRTFPIELNSGMNKIEVSVVNSLGVESLKEAFELRCDAAGAAKPDLYLVSIGVSDFADNNFDLTYASKDARDLTNAYKLKTDIFNKINLISLTDSAASIGNILKAKQTLKKSKPDDVVVLFVASHGLLDNSLDYYLATPNTDFANPSQGGLLYDQFESLIDSIPSRKRVVFMDACHSGELDKEDVKLEDATAQPVASIKSRGFKTVVQKEGVGLENSFELMQSMFADLKKGTGATIISSASGTEFAFESAQWKNGVFTFSLLEGLTTKKSDADKNGRVQVSELKDYVIKRVVDLTSGKQHPTSRSENIDLDFNIW